MPKIVTVYSPEGEEVNATRPNAVDLVRHNGYTWRPGVTTRPNDPAMTDLSEKDNFPDLSENSETGHTQQSYRDHLEEEATNLGVKFQANLGDEKLEQRIKEKREELEKASNTIDGQNQPEDDEDEDGDAEE